MTAPVAGRGPSLTKVGDLTIAVCTYNRASSLKETLASINQCVLPYGRSVELIVVDNNSTDGTPQVCADFAKAARMPFRYLIESNQGLSHARNLAMREAHGHAIVFTDDDVIVQPAWIRTYSEEFVAGADCVFGRIAPDWRGHKPEWFSPELGPAYALLDYGPSRFVVQNRRHEFFGANFALRKDLLCSIGGFDVHLGRTKDRLHIGEETRVFLQLLERGANIVYNPAIDVQHVIEERRKSPEYLRRYFHDTAESLVYEALRQPSRLMVAGFPAYWLSHIVRFFLALPVRLLRAVVRRDRAADFLLRLHARRYLRIAYLFLTRARSAKQ